MARTARRKPEDEGIVRAQLDGAARRLLHLKVDYAEAVEALRKITTDPRIMGVAAGRALAGWERSEFAGYHGDRVADLLLSAGADPEVCQQSADETHRRLAVESRHSGIGNP